MAFRYSIGWYGFGIAAVICSLLSLGCQSGDHGSAADSVEGEDSKPNGSGESVRGFLKAAQISSCNHPVRWYLDPANVDYTEPGTDAYSVPTQNQRRMLRRSIRLGFEGFGSRAVDLADELDYTLCVADTADGGGALVWVPRPVGAQTGYARFAIRPNGEEVAPLVVSAPHPLNDTHTDEQAITVFEEATARAVIIAGAHRCTNTTPTDCSGAIDSKKCDFDSSPYNYFEADMAHTDESYFHAAHVAIDAYGGWKKPVIGQLHGFSDDDVASGYSAEAIVSDGTVDYASPAYVDVAEDSKVARLVKQLRQHFGASTLVSSCNEFPSVSGLQNVRLREFLCGQSVTQNHMVNESSAPCELQKSPSSNGRYIHLEQSWDLREPSGNGPERVAEAFRQVFD